MSLTRSSFTYQLPEELIAEYPCPERSASKLMVWDPVAQSHQHSIFKNLPDFLTEKDLLVFNDTRVHHARLLGRKLSGGAVEVFIERLWPDGTATAMIKASKAPKEGALLEVEGHQLKVERVEKPLYRVRGLEVSIEWLMDQFGHVPLPPYIQRPDTASDQQRYQTVYANSTGSAAAPTAGLHFDENLFSLLEQRHIETAFLTLHVGLGTFAPIRVEQLSDHNMHAEWFEVTQPVVNAIERTRQRGGRVVAVGTTTLRALESTSQILQATEAGSLEGIIKPYSGESRLFITPGYRFQVVDALITNFHLPESTLLMLVSAFAGYEQTLQTYQKAVEHQYRFFSFGDAMFISRRMHPDQEHEKT